MADIIHQIGGVFKDIYRNLPAVLPYTKEVEKVIIKEIRMLSMPQSARTFVQIAGVSGAIAVAFGAYGAHVFREKNVDLKLKDTFDIANKYHFIHTLALLAVPMTRKPVLSGTLMLAGLVLFCGSCYFHALTNNVAIRKVTPYGGFLLMFAWASMAL